MMTADQFRSQFYALLGAVCAGEVVRVDLGDGAVAQFALEKAKRCPAPAHEADPADPTGTLSPTCEE